MVTSSGTIKILVQLAGVSVWTFNLRGKRLNYERVGKKEWKKKKEKGGNIYIPLA